VDDDYDRAISWITNYAPRSIQGHNGSGACFLVALKLIHRLASTPMTPSRPWTSITAPASAARGGRYQNFSTRSRTRSRPSLAGRLVPVPYPSHPRRASLKERVFAG
jgi:hypothetical protein